MIESGDKQVNEVVVDSYFFFSIYRDVRYFLICQIRNVLELKIEARSKNRTRTNANCETTGGMCAGFRISDDTFLFYGGIILPVLRPLLEYGGSGTTLPRF
jgi:hypothetical protein